jgi:hypothetical protein
LNLCNLGKVGHYSIYSAHATIVVAGWDCSKYTSYSFLYPGPATCQERSDEQDEEDDGDEDKHENEYDPELVPPEDGFGTEGWDEAFVAEKYNLDPRVRFICAVQYRVVLALQEYESLVAHLHEIEAWVRRTTSLCCTTILTKIQMNISMDSSARTVGSEGPAGKCLTHRQLADCVSQMIRLIIRFHELLSESIRAWSKFSGVQGDIACFSDLTDEMACTAMDNIRDAFEVLSGLVQKLKSLEGCFQETAKIVSIEKRITMVFAYRYSA